MISNSCATTSCYTTARRTSTHQYWWISCTRALLSRLPLADFRRDLGPLQKLLATIISKMSKQPGTASF